MSSEAPDSFTGIALASKDGVGTLELCRPEVLNRFDEVLHSEFPRALGVFSADESIRVALLKSTGKVFSAGGSTDIMKDAMSSLPRRLELIDHGRALFRAICDFPKPLVVALEGDTYGLGATVALMGDALVTHPNVKIADTHILMGITAGDGGVVAWPASVGLMVAKRHLLTGEALSGERAYQLGAVSDLVAERGAVLGRATEIAAKIASLPPMAVQLTKRAFNKLQSSRIEEAFDLGFYLEAMSFGTEDVREAVNAFLEKRPGVWTGR